MKPWDGSRPLSQRTVLGQRSVTARGLSLRFATEQIDRATDWCCVDETRHLIYVHRLGRLRSMETDLDWGPSGRGVPRIGDIWVVPAGDRCASLVEGDTAAYCEIAIPDRVLGATSLIPRIKHRDPTVHHVVEKIHQVADRDDAVAGLLRDSLVETLRLLIADTYTLVAPPRAEHGRGALDGATRATIVEYLEDSLDSAITLEVLARLARMSVSNFIKAFKATFHTTPHQFLLDLRIDRAKTLLLTSAETVTEISVRVGFSTPNHFATAFKHRVGVSPRAYRDSR